MPIAETFTFRDDDGVSLSDIARLDTMVTVVDAVNFMRDYLEAQSLKDINAEQNRDMFNEFAGEIDHILVMGEIGNPNGYGNNVDELIGLFNDKVIFKL